MKILSVGWSEAARDRSDETIKKRLNVLNAEIHLEVEPKEEEIDTPETNRLPTPVIRLLR